MTKRDFELIAAVIRAENEKAYDYSEPGSAEGALRAVAQDFAGRLSRVNPRFDRARFMKACGFGEG